MPKPIVTSTRPLADIARDHATSRVMPGLAAAVFAHLADGQPVALPRVEHAFFHAALTCATRKGQSMARRAMTADLERLRESLEPDGEGNLSLPQPKAYTVGAPVGVTLNDDGTVEVVVYLGEIDDVDEPPANVTETDLGRIANAIADGRFTVTASKGA